MNFPTTIMLNQFLLLFWNLLTGLSVTAVQGIPLAVPSTLKSAENHHFRIRVYTPVYDAATLCSCARLAGRTRPSLPFRLPGNKKREKTSTYLPCRYVPFCQGNAPPNILLLSGSLLAFASPGEKWRNMCRYKIFLCFHVVPCFTVRKIKWLIAVAIRISFSLLLRC